MGRSIAEHVSFVTNLAHPLTPEPLPPRTGHVLAEDAVAELPVPPFTNSAMDGFVVNRSDLSDDGPWNLRIIGDVPAGSPAQRPGLGEAVRIMTGAPTGEHTDGLVVIPVEDTSGDVRIHQAPGPGRSHIRPRGENITPGDVVVPAGTLVDAGALAALISTGVTTITAHPLPRVTVISSGSELAEPGAPLIDGHLPDSNRPMIAALARANGSGHIDDLHASDDPTAFRRALDDAASTSDLIITTGGISAGDHDVVKHVTRGESMFFGHVDLKPGAPQGAGHWHGTPLICLPGNPVAAFVSFHLFVVPVLHRLAGRPVERARVRVRLVDKLPAATDVARVVPVRLRFDGEVTATPFHPRGRSHLVASLADTHGLAVVEPGMDGDILDVILTNN